MHRMPPIHPLLVAVFPALFLYAENLSELHMAVLWKPLAALAVACALVWTLLSLIMRNVRKGAVVTSLLFALFFSFATLRSFVPQFTWVLPGGTIGPRKLTFGTETLLLVVATWLTFRTRRDLRKFSLVLNVAALTLILVPVVAIVGHELTARVEGAVLPTPLDEEDRRAPTRVDSAPDIYYIIMDAYGREDVLKRLYDHDNSEFTQWLKARGFYVAERSATNYPTTYLAVPSPLQMDYVENFVSLDDNENVANQNTMRTVVNNCRVVRFLRRRGYEIVAFSSGCTTTEMESADVYLRPGWCYDEFSNAVLDMTPLRTFFRNMDPYERRRRHLNFLFKGLEVMASRPGPKFVFAHIPAPHRPFVFGRDGEPVNDLPCGLSTLAMPMGDAQIAEYRRAYADELVYINKRLRETLDAVITRSDRPPVIVIQGDHGPLSMWGDPVRFGERAVHERYPILNAYYFPDGPDPALYPAISPVNSFRVVLNHVFGTRYELLPDRNFAPDKGFFDLRDITHIVVKGETDTVPQGDKP